MSRRALAVNLKLSGQFGSITNARWARAMTFERMVHDQKNASEIVTTTLGDLGFSRPTGVSIVDARMNTDRTVELLATAHARAISAGTATLIFQLSVPFVGFEGDSATEVKPDFVVVAPDPTDAIKTWVIPGDVKDYERVRSHIDDMRLLKGYLQVAIAAESLDAWTRIPEGMAVHSHGVLAVPRNSFLQPEARVELLDDHRAEVRMRINERISEASTAEYDENTELEEFVSHLTATFDPTECQTCTLFAFCRQQLRDSDDPTALLIEIGIAEPFRADFLWAAEGSTPIYVPASVRSRVKATTEGLAQPTGQRRVDPAGQPGTINVVIAKSDSTTLGVYGLAVQRVGQQGVGDWVATVFDAPQSDDARRGIARAIGTEIVAALKDRRQAAQASGREPDPVHLVVPDARTADILTSIADHLAGAELSRLRWENDRVMGRPALTFNGDPAQVPRPLSEQERTGVSFLLEEDRARAFTLRSPVIVLQRVLPHLMVAGGPPSNAMRLDYLVEWARASDVDCERHRRVGDEIEAEIRTPGAVLTPQRANGIHEAFVGTRASDVRPAQPVQYEALVLEELGYKSTVVDVTLGILADIPMSHLAVAYRAIEGDAQEIWRRRLSLHASDLVRFGRVAPWWRNALVDTVETDDACRKQLNTLINPTIAADAAMDAGSRDISNARVVKTDPLVLEIDSRRLESASRLVLLHINGQPCVEQSGVSVSLLKGSVKISDLSIGPLTPTKQPNQWAWSPEVVPPLSIGDELIVGNFGWFSENKGNRALNVKRPTPDTTSSPQVTCEHGSYEADPSGHKYCCRPHEDIEAEVSNKFADRRARGELNPQTWPPIVDSDGFEVVPTGARIEDPNSQPVTEPPAHLTSDQLD